MDFFQNVLLLELEDKMIFMCVGAFPFYLCNLSLEVRGQSQEDWVGGDTILWFTPIEFHNLEAIWRNFCEDVFVFLPV